MGFDIQYDGLKYYYMILKSLPEIRLNRNLTETLQI